jgi:hypothetical protein
MTIDTSQNIGVGTTAPSVKMDVNGTVRSKTSTGGVINMDSTTTSTTNTVGSYANAGAAFADLNYSAAQHIWLGSGSEKMRIDSSGNVGIGTASPTSFGSTSRVLQVQSADATGYGSLLIGSGTYTMELLANQNSGVMSIGSRSNNNLSIVTNDTPRMTIDTSGNVLVGTTSTTSVNAGIAIIPNASSSTVGYIRIGHSSASSGNGYVDFLYNNGIIGSITQNGTTAVAFNTSSDYRLKENVTPMTTGLATIGALKPVTYDWISDKSKGEGFIAHELQEIIPLAVTGEKDAVDEDGNPRHQGVDYSKIVVHLVAAVQELTARIAALEAK